MYSERHRNRVREKEREKKEKESNIMQQGKYVLYVLAVIVNMRYRRKKLVNAGGGRCIGDLDSLLQNQETTRPQSNSPTYTTQFAMPRHQSLPH